MREMFLLEEKLILKLNEDDILYSNWYGWFNDEKLCKLTP